VHPERQLLFLELNEICFDTVEQYCQKGLLPNFRAFISERGWARTTSESKYEQLEPWIQWVTAHTGLDFAEHGVFRLGDIVHQDIPQIWEMLEAQGLRVGAVSPMNAKNRVREAAFFLPDPWTKTPLTASPTLKRLIGAIAQAVNDNASSRISGASVAALIAGLARYAGSRNYLRYIALAGTSLRRPWRRALFLDLLLADVFVTEVRRTRPQFASLFLNAGAHIQHHYMFSSAAYSGDQKNPAWYAPEGADPVLEVYSLYDRILGRIANVFPKAQLMIATGLRQVPYPKLQYYWRLKDHERFLRGVGVDFLTVEPRMSRDFLVCCADDDQARRAAERLRSAVDLSGDPLFEVDNRGKDLFVMLVYPGPIEPSTEFRIGGKHCNDLHSHVAFVALKNGEHDGTGYFLDSAAERAPGPTEFPLREIPQRIAEALGLTSLRVST
jgi:hypothetical protein